MSKTINWHIIIPAILLILLAAGITFRVFYRGAYRWQDDLVWQAGAAVLAGFWFGRHREKNNWAFFLAGAGLLGFWSYALVGFFPQLDGWRAFFEPIRMIRLPNNLLSWEYLPATISVLLVSVYLLVWIARYSSESKWDAILRLFLFLTLPAVLLPLCLVLVIPFHPQISYYGTDIMQALIWTVAGISTVPILTMLILAILKVRFAWKRLLAAYAVLILISCAGWGFFYGVQLIRRAVILNRLAAEGRPMTLQAYYGRLKNVKDGTEQLAKLIEFLKNPEFDTKDFPLNSARKWLKKDVPESAPNNYIPSPDGFGLKRSRKDAMIRISESPAGKKFTAGLAELAEYDHIQFDGNYTDNNQMGKVLNNMRFLVRTGTARAAIAHYTGNTEQILPRLKAVTPVSRLLNRQPWMICGIISSRLDMVVVSQVVGIGPDGEQYADDYRFFLNWIRARDYTSSWAETEVCAEQLKYYDKIFILRNEIEALSFFPLRPLVLETLFREVERSIRREKILAAHFEPEKDDPSRWSFQTIAARKRIMETALALKLYCSLHGHYPIVLSALVPEILPKLPLNPMNGKEIKYRMNKDRFEISLESENIKYQIRLKSSPNY